MLVAIALLGASPVVARANATTPTRTIQPALASMLSRAAADHELVVLVRGDTTSAALGATAAAGMRRVEVFDRLAVVAASGTPDAIRLLHRLPGVRRVDPNQRLELLDDSAHHATGVAQLRDPSTHPSLHALQRARGRGAYDGTGVSIAIVDVGFDTTHPQFVEDGATKFDVHLRQACLVGHDAIDYYTGSDPTPNCSAWVPATPRDLGLNGHGTMTASVAAGYPRTTDTGIQVSGTARGARLVGLSAGIDGVSTYNAFSALNWVLEHHADPCGDRSCPPIRVVSNSYGDAADNPGLESPRTFDPEAPMSLITSELIKAGVVVIFAAGNSQGDGSTTKTNILALHPDPGVLGVGGYHDGNAGDRNVGVWHGSSRGRRGQPVTHPDLIAPATWYTTACASLGCVTTGPEGSGYGQALGTSIAAPYVAGVVAQLIEANPALAPADIEDILEDTAHDIPLNATHLEPDPSNTDDPTSFDGGHGLVDAVAALSRVLHRGARAAPEPCGRSAELSINDPAGDTRVLWHADPPGNRHEDDLISVYAALAPDRLTMRIRYADVPETDARMVTRLWAFLDGHDLSITMARDPNGYTTSVDRGGDRITAVASVDPAADTVTITVQPLGDTAIGRASVLPYTSNGVGVGDADTVQGGCSIWAT